MRFHAALPSGGHPETGDGDSGRQELGASLGAQTYAILWSLQQVQR